MQARKDHGEGRISAGELHRTEDDERYGTFEPLRLVSRGKMAVLGLVITESGRLEDKDTLKRRIDEASRYVALDQLCVSPQCGFSSTLEGNDLTHDEQRAKLG